MFFFVLFSLIIWKLRKFIWYVIVSYNSSNIHCHVSSATDNDRLKFWYIWRWIWLFILNIFVDCIKVGHCNLNCMTKIQQAFAKSTKPATDKNKEKRMCACVCKAINKMIQSNGARVCFGVSVCNCKHVGDDVVCLSLLYYFYFSFLPRFAELTLCEHKNDLIDDLWIYKMCDVEKRNVDSTLFCFVSFVFFFCLYLCFNSIYCLCRMRPPISLSPSLNTPLTF